MRDPRLIAFDLDGTLLDAACRIPEAHATTLLWLQRRGIAAIIVTGRPLLTAAPVHRALGLDTPLVCFNGVWVGHPDRPPIAERPLDEASVRSALTLLRNQDGSICVYPGTRWQMHRFTDRTRGWPGLYGVSIEEAPDLVDTWTGTSCKVMFVAEPPVITAVAPLLKEHLTGRCHVSVSQPDRVEVIRAGVDKANGLQLLCKHLGIAQEETWAVGDAANDLEMLAWAGKALVMGHAPETVRAIADHVLPGIDDAGISTLPALLDD